MNKLEQNKDLDFIKQILEWAINEADLDYLEGLRSRISEVIDFRKIGGDNKEVWKNRMIEEVIKVKERNEYFRK